MGGTHIGGLQVGAEYWCEVEEDPEEAGKERKGYTAPTADDSIRGAGGGGEQGEDSSSCSCIEGNPCAVKYNCKDWNNREEVARKHGWKGF